MYILEWVLDKSAEVLVGTWHTAEVDEERYIRIGGGGGGRRVPDSGGAQPPPLPPPRKIPPVTSSGASGGCQSTTKTERDRGPWGVGGGGVTSSRQPNGSLVGQSPIRYQNHHHHHQHSTFQHPVSQNRVSKRHHGAGMGCCDQKKLLMLTTSTCACASFAFLCIAVATDYWLHAMELVPVGNGSNVYNNAHLGLWRECKIEILKSPEARCDYIEYFKEIDTEGLGTTDAIIVSMRRATLFPLVSLLMLLLGEITCFLGHCNHKKKVLTFISGILFVVGGLCTLVGIIIYIGAITEEVGNKSNATMDEPKFKYYYGSSFVMTVSSFIVSELTGVLSVYLYLSRHQQTYNSHQQRRVIAETVERPPPARYRRSRSYSERSREFSRDNSPSHGSDTYYTYTPVSDTSKEMSSYTLNREPSRHTLSTSADTHLSKDYSLHSVREFDTLRRTTPV